MNTFKTLLVALQLTLFLGVHFVSGSISDPPRVTLKDKGILVGKYLKTIGGRTVDAFLGVPFAKPPIGDLRFTAPQKVEPWEGEKIVDRDGSRCLQCLHPVPFNGFGGSEDCLYLNVYVPHELLGQGNLSVLLWIHGGAFKWGASDSISDGPQILLDYDIILVTSAYRVGPFGFLSTGTTDAPGNFGLKDQAFALKWIKDNIEEFGGNPNSVTIGGQSAGAAAASLHMLSPLSDGLFHQLILQSGNYFDPWVMIDNDTALNRTITLAMELGCEEIDDFKELISCLRNVSTDDYVDFMCEMKFDLRDLEPLTYFAPVVEPDVPDAFLPQNPYHIRSAKPHTFPIIIGVTSHEGLISTTFYLTDLQEEYVSHLHEILPRELFCDKLPVSKREEIIQKISDFYLNGERNFSSTNFENYTNLFGDALFNSGMDRFLRHRFAAETFAPTFVYNYQHKGFISSTQLLVPESEYVGVSHADDLLFLYPLGQEKRPRDFRDLEMQYVLPKMWTDFVKTGHPTPPDSPVTPKWIEATKYPLNYAQLGSHDWHRKKANESSHTVKGQNQIGDVSSCGSRKTIASSQPKKCPYTIVQNKVGFIEDRINFWRTIEDDLHWNYIDI